MKRATLAAALAVPFSFFPLVQAQKSALDSAKVNASLAASDAPAQPDDKSDAKPDAKLESKDKKPGLPLTPARKIEYTTTEGTWLSLDVSPGRQDAHLRPRRSPLRNAT